MSFSVFLVEPRYAGNIGAVARCMKNFGISDLYIVGESVEIDDDTIRMAMHADDILNNAIFLSSFEKIHENVDYLVGTTSISSKNEKYHLRNNISVRAFKKIAKKIDGRIGLIFGREDFGLFNHELEQCDTVITIPCSMEYPTLNISHSACIIFYELFEIINKNVNEKERTAPTGEEKEILFDTFSRFLNTINYPHHKKKNTEIMFRRIMGRAVLSKYECSRLIGVFSRGLKILNSTSFCQSVRW